MRFTLAHSRTGKAPQVSLESDDARSQFDSFFTQALPYLISHNFRRSRFNSGDVYWWIVQHPGHSREIAILMMFSAIHRNVSHDFGCYDSASMLIADHRKHSFQCGRFRCLPACRVWRKTIAGFCKDSGWRVPSLMDRLLEDFRATSYVCYLESDTPVAYPKSPLRPPQPTVQPPMRLRLE